MALSSLAERRLRPELMDRPNLDSAEHVRALCGLRRLNAASGVFRQLWQVIADESGVEPGGRLRILDVASGGGDVALGLWTLARQRGVEAQILGLDISSTACEQASRHCHTARGSITFQCTDVVAAALPRGFDVVTSSLFLHHLRWNAAAELLAKMAAAGRLAVVSDLRRSPVGYAIAHAACRVLTRSRIVRNDGPQSVANAFTVGEARELCRAAGLTGAVVRRSWPWRWMMIHKGRREPHARNR